MRRVALALAALLALSACGVAPPPPQSPAQAVYEAEGAYAIALSLAVRYRFLPPCRADRGPPCSKPELVKKIQDADDVAWRSITAAQNAVRDKPADSTLGLLVAAAREAVAAYRDIVREIAQ